MDTRMSDLEGKLRALSEHAWDDEVGWAHINAWRDNFTGNSFAAEEERLHSMFGLSRFIYFSKRMVREMLLSLYREHFEGPLIRRIRRNLRDTRDIELVRSQYQAELFSSRFISVGNPSESGAHLLYYLRQVNRLPKDLFADIHGAFEPRQIRRIVGGKSIANIEYIPRNQKISRYVFFDDLVGSGDQVSEYLLGPVAQIRKTHPSIDLRFLCLFSTSEGLKKLNQSGLFNGRATALFELDKSYKAFEADTRYFRDVPDWFSVPRLKTLTQEYGRGLYPGRELGHKNGQLLLAFSHNTPDNVPAMFWVSDPGVPWRAVFVRYDKNYGAVS